MKVKVYAKREIELPFAATLYSPSRPDPRLEVPARLENDPYMFGKSKLERGAASGVTRRNRKLTAPPLNAKMGDFANGSAHIVSESQKMMSSKCRVFLRLEVDATHLLTMSHQAVAFQLTRENNHRCHLQPAFVRLVVLCTQQARSHAEAIPG